MALIRSLTSSGSSEPSTRRNRSRGPRSRRRAARSSRGTARGGCGSPRACRRRGSPAGRRRCRRCPRSSGGSNSTWKMWPSLTHVRRPPRRRTTSSSETSIRIAAVSARPSSSIFASSASAWAIVRGKPSRMNPSPASLRETRSAIRPDHHLVGHQVAPIHVLLRLVPELGALADRGAKDVAGRVVRQAEVLLQPLALGSLAGPGRAEQDEIQLRHRSEARRLTSGERARHRDCYFKKPS